jgi:hypothetical protein
MSKCHFQIGRGDRWCDFEYPVAIRRWNEVVGWAREQCEATILLYAANARRDGKRYLPPLAEKLSAIGGCSVRDARLEIDQSGTNGVGGCHVAITCGGQVLAWMRHRRHAMFIAEAVNRAMQANAVEAAAA